MKPLVIRGPLAWSALLALAGDALFAPAKTYLWLFGSPAYENRWWTATLMVVLGLLFAGLMFLVLWAPSQDNP